MKALLAKEIRLMLPVYVAALMLAIVPVWLLPNHLASTFNVYALYPFGCGAVLLAIATFGREFNLNTFPVLLAQPLERAAIWRTKVVVLAVGMATIFGVWCLTSEVPIRFVLAGGVDPGRSVTYIHGIPAWFEKPVGPEVLAVGGMMVLAAFSGGLWTTLLLRQVTAAFWFTILLPGTIAMVIDLFGGNKAAVFTGLGLYSVAGFLLARKLFLRAEEVAWTGGVLVLPGWKSSGSVAARSEIRAYRPWAAMIRKEFQLHQIGLAGIAILFAVHLGTLVFRSASFVSKVASTGRLVSDLCCLLWFIVPLFMGATAVAEERKLGTMEAHLCLPMRSRVQFAIKLLFVMLLGGVLSAALFWIKIRIGHSMPGYADVAELNSVSDFASFIRLAGLFTGIALLAFFASTLTRNLMQALVTALVTVAFVWGLTFVAVPPNGYGSFARFLARVLSWKGDLGCFIGAPTLTAAFIWLSYRNFRRLSETWRLWRRNLLVLFGAVLFIGTATAALYNRAWEFLTPLEPRHGTARIAAGKPPRLSSHGYTESGLLTVLLPDGRLWEDSIVYRGVWRFNFFGSPYSLRLGGKWGSLGGNHFVDGSNWVDVVASYRDTAAIRSDGTLWVSEKPRARIRGGDDGLFFDFQPETLVRIGDDVTNWQRMIPIDDGSSKLLLKTDGTLWLWEAWDFDWKKPWPGLRGVGPYRLGTESDWTDIISASGPVGYPDEMWLYAWKNNGQAWGLTGPFNQTRRTPKGEIEPGKGLERRKLLDQTKWRSVTGWNPQWEPFQAGVREDGSLWVWDPRPYKSNPAETNKPGEYRGKIGQMDGETNWAQVACENRTMVALKTDGTLWRWDPESRFIIRPSELPASRLPVRMGTHDDWVAVCATRNGFISLAADGSLWHWWDHDADYYWDDGRPLLAGSRKPVKIGNIFGQE